MRKLHQDGRLDLTVIHGDGTTTAAKKGGGNLGYSGHKHLKGDKVAAFCDRDCNIISPFIAAAGNRNESPLLRDALPKLSEMARAIDAAIFEERFRTIERVFAWEDKFRRLLLRFERISQVHYAFKTLAYTLINLRHYCRS